ncbi:MAG: hypothetical protein ACOC1P_03545, partial [Minisyncoccales bacterium]
SRGNGKKYFFEEAKSLFLTADKRLVLYNINEYGHSEKSRTIPEAILCDALVRILWLKKPDLKSNIPIHNIIAGQKRNLIIDHSVWSKFIKNIKEQKQNGQITEDDINSLIAKKEIEQELLKLQRKSSEVSDEKIKLFIQSNIEKRKKEDAAKTKQVKRLEEENLLLKNKLSKQNKEKIEIIEIRRKEIEKECRKKCKTKWRWIIGLVVLLLLILFILIVLCVVFKNRNNDGDNVLSILKDISFTILFFAGVVYFFISLVNFIRFRGLEWFKPNKTFEYLKKFEDKRLEECIRKKKEKLSIFDQN